MNDLVAWGCDQDIKVHADIDLLTPGKYGSQGTATADISPCTIASIPFSACLTPLLACQELQLDFAEVASKNLEGPVLALYLILQKRDPNSRWKAYIDSLPKTFLVPYYWSDMALWLLRGTDLEKEPGVRKALLSRQRDEVLKMMPHHVPLHMNEWVWAMTVLSSRSFPSRLINQFSPPPKTTVKQSSSRSGHGSADAKDPVSHPILLPVLDTFNHDDKIRISWITNHDTQRIEFVTHDAIPSGKQVYNNYGTKSCEELILGYGFCDGGIYGVTLQRAAIQYHLTLEDPIPAALMREIHANGRPHEGLFAIREKMKHKRDIMNSTNIPWSSDEPDYKLAKDYQLSHLYVVLTAESRAEELLNELTKVTLTDAFTQDEFRDAVQICFGVDGEESADNAELCDVILALYLIIRKVSFQHQEIEAEGQREAAELWQQISSCRKVSPAMFGQLRRQDFINAISKVWTDSVELDGVLTVFIYE